MSFRVMILTILLAISSFGALAHGGKTDSKGCHHDKKHGGYHCH